MKTSSESMIAMTRKPVRPSQGAAKFDFPCNKSSPSEGDPGGKPKPRKSSAVNVVIELLRTNGRNVRVATIAFGKTWLRMVAPFERPRARAAFTYSKFLARKNSARTTCTSDTQENNRRMPRSTKKLGVMIEEIMIKR